MKRWMNRIIFYAGLLVVWFLIGELKIWPDYFVPTPVGVWQSFMDGLSDRSFFIGTLASLKRIGIGYGISAGIGVILGIITGRNQFLDETLGSLLTGLQSLPSVCWLPLSILWFGLNDAAIIFVVVMGALLAIATVTISGVKTITPIYIKAGKNMGANGFKLLTTILIPAALPSIISGLKQGWSFAWRALMAGELLYVSIGLGQLLMLGRELNDMNRLIAVMLVLIFIGLVFDRLVFANLEIAVRRRWGYEH
ncbi:MAG TPA: ABC transporter permease [Bacillota bacterium]|nr:ABC transporter permease [Bacillota bacterium]HPT88592.1 ABC transporter permease [Bacillota bacterium]